MWEIKRIFCWPMNTVCAQKWHCDCVIVIVIIIIIIGNGDQFSESHSIIWKGQSKSNEFYKREHELYPSVQGSTVINRNSFRIWRIHLHNPEAMVRTAQSNYLLTASCVHNQHIITNMGRAHWHRQSAFVGITSFNPFQPHCGCFDHFTEAETEIICYRASKW